MTVYASPICYTECKDLTALAIYMATDFSFKCCITYAGTCVGCICEIKKEETEAEQIFSFHFCLFAT